MVEEILVASTILFAGALVYFFGGSLSSKQSPTEKEPFDPYALEIVAQHNTPEDNWIHIGNKVYDVTLFSEHPGGPEVLLRYAGKDATKAFHDVYHSADAIQMLSKFEVDLERGKNVKAARRGNSHG